MIGEYPEFTEREIAIIRGWAAENHRKLHHAKNLTGNRSERIALSEEMREVESISEKLGRLL